MRGEPESYAQQALTSNRASCYRNAAKAWYMTGALDEGRRQLEDAARADPSCGDEIRRILELLGH